MDNQKKAVWNATTPKDVKLSDHLPIEAFKQLRNLLAKQREDCEKELSALRLARAVADAARKET